VRGIRHDLDDGIQTGMRDLQNRARGLVAETSARFNKNQPNDWVLAERARSRLGFITAHARALTVTAQEGKLILEGDALRSEIDPLLTGLAQVRGITGIDNRLRVHDEPGDIPTLQASERRMSQMQGNWTPSSRLLAGAGALYLFLRSRRGGFLGPFYTLGSLILGLRAVTNRPVKQMLGGGQDPDLIHINKTVQIQAPLEGIYELWANFTEFPRFMAHVKEIHDLGDGRSHWVVDGPAGIPVEFETVVTQQIPNEMIAWRTVEDSPVKHTGQVRFHPSPRGGTQVHVQMAYKPPAGVIGHAVAAFFGSDPKSQMDDDLMRLKGLFETGQNVQADETLQEGQGNR
jgi:uncharacterized membrane protein